MTDQGRYSKGAFCTSCFCLHDQLESDLVPQKIQASIVIPLYNEEESINELLAELNRVQRKLPISLELILVDDASTDETPSKLQAAKNLYKFRTITLHKNSGHASAIWCGMRHAEGEVIVTMDGDLQHPPELIPLLINEFDKSKVDVVYAIRNDLVSERRTKRITSHVFYFTFRYVFGLRLVPYANDFRLIRRSYFDTITSRATRVEIMRALLATCHHSYNTLGFDLQARKVGESKFTYRKMLNLYGRTLLYAPWRRSVFWLILGLVISGLVRLNTHHTSNQSVITAIGCVAGLLTFSLGALIPALTLYKKVASVGAR